MRQLLRRLITAGFSLLLIGFVYILVRGLGGGPELDRPAEFSDITIGQTAKRRLQGQRVWVTRFDQTSSDKLDAEHPCAITPVCIVSAVGQNDSVDIMYSAAPPPQLARGIEWNGGFVDPSSGVVYDLSGRAIQPADAEPLIVLQP